MNAEEKYYIRNIVLSYLEACLINREPQKKLQEDIAKQRMSVLKSVIQKQVQDEVQAVYAIQNFVHKLEHPPSREFSCKFFHHAAVLFFPPRNGSISLRYLL